MNPNSFSKYYFIGIGGIGMSALARHFNALGKWVGGYDKTPSAITQALEEEGIWLTFESHLEAIKEFTFTHEDTLIIYTPAVPKDHEQLVYFQDQSYQVLKRAKVLGLLSEHSECMAVAGTHGKTTTSTLLAHLFKHNGYGINAFLGGISTNYNSNYLSGNDTGLVVEADEFDQSFLQLHPQYALITSTDADHLDIYGDAENLKDNFKKFAALSRSKGTLVAHHLCGIEADYYYGREDHCHFAALNVKVHMGQFVFDLKSPMGVIRGIRVHMPGYHNIENSVGAAAIALLRGLNLDQVKAGLETYLGVKRRFQYIVRNEEYIFIDDYAHHPEEIKASLNAVKMLYPKDKIHLVFQPHLFSRTRDFMEGFAKSLSMADDVCLLDIYPAREQPIEGINSSELLKLITCKSKRLLSKEELIEWMRSHKPKVLVTMGAGDIDRLIEPLKKIYVG